MRVLGAVSMSYSSGAWPDRASGRSREMDIKISAEGDSDAVERGKAAKRGKTARREAASLTHDSESNAKVFSMCSCC